MLTGSCMVSVKSAYAPRVVQTKSGIKIASKMRERREGNLESFQILVLEFFDSRRAKLANTV